MNPLIIPPDSLRMVLAQAKEDMKRNPRLHLCQRIQNINIWNYYSIMKVTPIIMEKLSFGHFNHTTGRSVSGDEFIQGSQYANLTPGDYMCNLNISWRVNIWRLQKISNMPALPNAWDIRICEATERYLCPHEPSTLSGWQNRMVRICTLQTRHREDRGLIAL